VRGLAGKVVVLAGGAGGIGTATCMRLAEEGATVVVGDLDGAAAEAIAARITAAGGQAAGTGVDVRDEASVARLFALAVDAFGGVDGAHVNAADLSPGVIFSDTDALGVDLGVFDHTLAVDLRGHVLCARAALPLLLERGGGAIVHTSSAAAFMGDRTRPSYAIAKSGINALVRHMAARWGKEGIRANAVAPGVVITPTVAARGESDFQRDALRRVASTRLGRPEDIAAMVAFLLSDDGEWVNGQVVSVDGGLTKR
jgi:NAD(P)-dependent dehydrogenase (short-subunit alcohol dehydrogenase family)